MPHDIAQPLVWLRRLNVLGCVAARGHGVCGHGESAAAAHAQVLCSRAGSIRARVRRSSCEASLLLCAAMLGPDGRCVLRPGARAGEGEHPGRRNAGTLLSYTCPVLIAAMSYARARRRPVLTAAMSYAVATPCPVLTCATPLPGKQGAQGTGREERG
eukprot:147281-Rhodomonas_salina.1